MSKSFSKVISGLIQGSTLITLAAMLIYLNYQKNLIMERLFHESTHILVLIIYLEFTENGKWGPVINDKKTPLPMHLWLWAT